LTAIRRRQLRLSAAHRASTLAAAAAVLCLCCGLWLPRPASARQQTAGDPQAKAKPAAQAPAKGAKPAKGKGAQAPASTGQKAGRPAAGAPGAPAGAAAAGAAGAAAGAGAGAAAGAAGRAPGSPPAIGSPTPDMGNIDQILEGDEEVLAGNSFTYDPGNRRDPFKSLLIAADRPEFRGPRPEGIPGLLIDEIDLKGIFRTARGYVAQVSAANQKKSFLLKVGDQLYDGDVVSIGKSEVVFKQIVQDPTALKPFREIVKSLNPH
jgi:hypothetical protein